MVMVHLTNYDYQTLVIVPKQNDNEYKNGVDEYVKEIMAQSNTIKLNNFRKRYKTYTEAFKQQNEQEMNETKSKVK